MNPLITGTLLGALLVPVPPVVPDRSADRVSTADEWPAPSRPAAVWPLEPRPEVITGFEPPSSTYAAGHRGVDLLGRPGADVRSAVAGRVTFAGTVAGRGVVVVDHGRFRTTYEPVKAVVRRGDQVDAGTAIGTLQTGLSHCEPRVCLHWGLVQDGEYLDPLTLLRGVRVRLLPLGGQARGWARW